MKTTSALLGSAFAFLLATSCCWLPWLVVAVGAASGAAAFTARLEQFSPLLMTLGVGLLGYAAYGRWQRSVKMKNPAPKIVLQSIITCPNCGFSKNEVMPTDACQFFYECENCKAMLKPQPGDCCVFCSYGTVPCPPMQAGDKDCCA